MTSEFKVGDKVKWIGNDGGWKIGTVLCLSANVCVDSDTFTFGCRVRRYHTGEYELIETERLSIYPSEPIPQP